MTKTAVILAPDKNGKQTIFGIPAVRRLVILAKRLGIADIHLFGAVDAFVPMLSDLIPPESFHPVGSPDVLGHAAESPGFAHGEKVLLLKAGHVTDGYSLARFLEAGKDKNAAVCFTQAEGGRGGDGFYLADPPHVFSILRFLWSPEEHEPAISQRIETLGGVTGLPYTMRGSSKDAEVAEAKLVSALSAQTKADDGFIARYFDRKISQFISKKVSHTHILPNQITLIGMTIGLIGALFLSMGGYWPQLVGALLFVSCVIVDGVDGEVARLKLKESTFGHYLDVVTDNIVHAAIFVGIAYGLYHNTGNEVYLKALWFLLGGFGFCIIAVYQCILRRSPDELARSPRIVRMMALLSNRDFAYLIAALAIFGRLDFFLIGSSIGSYLFAVALWAVSFQERRKR